MREVDVVVIGGGQSALATGYYLRRTGLSFILLDDQPAPGGGWRHTWPSLHLFSPAQWSSLPGWLMPRDITTNGDGYPTREGLLDYLAQYERRFSLQIERPAHVDAVRWNDGHFTVSTSVGELSARAIVSATGSWSNPDLPELAGQERFQGRIIHSANYAGPLSFTGLRVVVVGGGNSGAQIVADLADVADVTWATREPPRFLPDDVDGRFLFEQATAR